jgi:hypothetical protein
MKRDVLAAPPQRGGPTKYHQLAFRNSLHQIGSFYALIPTPFYPPPNLLKYPLCRIELRRVGQ